MHQLWKIAFLDETSKYVADMILFRNNMLSEYSKQMAAGGAHKFSAKAYYLANGGTPAEASMVAWYDAHNNFSALAEGLHPAEASLIMSTAFDKFADIFDADPEKYKDAINGCFDRAISDPSGYVDDGSFEKTLERMFTLDVDLGGKPLQVNLMDAMEPTGRVVFMKRLDEKCEEEYKKWLAANSQMRLKQP